MVQRVCACELDVLEGEWQVGMGSQGVRSRWFERGHRTPSRRCMSNSSFCTPWPETPNNSKRTETSIFCTGGLRLFELRGRILREKRPPDQQASCGVRQGKRAPRPGALCSAPDTLRPNKRPRRRHSGIARGMPIDCGEATPPNTAMHLYAMDTALRPSDARQCRICCNLTKSENAGGGL